MKTINGYKEKESNNIGIRVNANESYRNISKNELKDILNEINNFEFNRYPDTESYDLRKAYGKVIGVKEENIIAGNGSDEMISLIITSKISRHKTVLTINPDFSMYNFYTALNDGIIRKYNTEEDGRFSINKFISFGKKVSPKVIIFSNPNNPTGHVIDSRDIEYVLEAFKESIVVVDEAYYEFYGQSMISYIEKYRNLIVTRTLSKAWGLASLRIGFLISNKELIKELNKYKAPYNLNSFSQIIGCSILNHPEKILKSVEEIVYERERLYKNLKQIENESENKIKFYESKANFIFGRFDLIDKLEMFLCQEGILIRYFDNDSFRITVGSPLENDLIVNTIKKALFSLEDDYEKSITN